MKPPWKWKWPWVWRTRLEDAERKVGVMQLACKTYEDSVSRIVCQNVGLERANMELRDELDATYRTQAPRKAKARR